MLPREIVHLSDTDSVSSESSCESSRVSGNVIVSDIAGDVRLPVDPPTHNVANKPKAISQTG